MSCTTCKHCKELIKIDDYYEVTCDHCKDTLLMDKVEVEMLCDNWEALKQGADE